LASARYILSEMQRVQDAPTAQESELALARRIASGDREALAELYQQYQRPLFRFLCQMTPDRGVAEEVLQDTMIAVWRSAGAFEGRSLLRTWLFGIARRQAHNTLRRRGVPLAEEAETAATAPGPEDEVMARLDVEELSKAVQQLSLVHREVLALAFVSGLGYQEIAAVLEVPEGTVKSRLSNARRALRGMLRE